MLERVHNILQQNCSLHPAKFLLVGVSGGPDSLSMLDILIRLGYPVIVAHMNHGLRPEAGEEAREVGRIAESYAAPFVLGNEDAAAYASVHVLSIEEAARALRYCFLFSQAEAYNAQAVLTAHTADDQVETILMHLLRGSGLAGLKGMPYCAAPNEWSRSIPLARPMLDVWREEVADYCEERGLSPLTDLSNLDVAYFRNRLRHELIPFLESYNPALRKTVWRMGQVLRGDHQILERLVESAWESCRAGQGQGYVAFHLSELRRHMTGLQRRLLRRAIGTLRPGVRDVDFEMVERALAFISEGPATGRSDIGVGLYLLLEGEKVWVAAWEAELPASEWPQASLESGRCAERELKAPGMLRLNDKWELHAWVVEDGDSLYNIAVANQDPFQAWVEAADLKDPLLVRCRRAGDRFRPLGLDKGSIKLGDFMTNVKMPLRARHAWPLVCRGKEIIWVPGYRINHGFRVRQDTRQALHFHLKR